MDPKDALDTVETTENAAADAEDTAVQENAVPAADSAPEEVPMEIVVDDGMEVIPIKNKHGQLLGQLMFRTTDILGLTERFNHMMDHFDEITRPLEAYSKADDSEEATEQAMEALKQAENRLRDELDYVLGGNASEAFFSEIAPFTPVNGAFYCETVLNKVADFMAQRFSMEAHKIKLRLNRHLTPNRQERRAGQKRRRR